MLKKIIIWFEKKKKISLSCLVLTFVVMFLVSGIPGSSIKTGSAWWLSVGYHMTIFAVFSFFLLAFLTGKNIDSKNMLLTILISILFGIFDEIHQLFVPFRSAGLEDVMIDLTGAVISVSLYSFIRRK